MMSIGWLWIALSVLGALVLAAVVWLAAPLVYIGDAQPFEGVVTRLALVTLILLITAGSLGCRLTARAMMEPAAEESDASILKERMEDALATLKRSGKSSVSALYDLPWYLII